MGSGSIGFGRRWWRHSVVGVAAVCLAVPFVSAAAAPTAAAGSGTTYLLAVAGNDLSVVTADVTQAGGQVLHSYPVASAVEVSLPAGVAPPAGAVVVPDQKLTFNSAPAAAAGDPVNTYRDTIGARGALAGSGVTVAVVDTGVADTGEIDVEHVNVSGGPQGDGLGHGTFLAGLIAGDGESSDGAYRGVAPGAKVFDVQVATADGSTSMSQVLAGLQAVADRQAVDPSLKVLSLALSTGSPLPPWLDPLTRALRSLWSDGVTVLVAAGNDGPDEVSSPASDPTLLAVGSIDEARTTARGDDSVADFSSSGRTFGAVRPDLVAPGVSLVSLKSPGSLADVENPASSVGAKYMKGSGTSMSEAVAAGAVASMLSARPTLTPNDVKRLLVGTTYTTAALRKNDGAGAGGLDLARAAQTSVRDTKPLKYDAPSGRFGPDEADLASWSAFAEAWEAGDLQGVVEAWIRLSPQTRKWAANAWSLAVLTQGLLSPDADFETRKWATRKWAIEDWMTRKWADDEWVTRKWASIDWTTRKWASETWLAAGWEGRKWAASDWLAFAWTARNGSAAVGDLVDESEWDTRKWATRKWATAEWTTRKWATDAWATRKWADYSWDTRKWADDSWTTRKWADFAFETRKWATEQWATRKWAVTGWEM